MFQTKNLNERSIDYKPFNVSTKYDVVTEPEEILARDHMKVSLELFCQYRTIPNDIDTTLAAERMARRAIIDMLYGQVLLKLNEIERAVYYGDTRLSLKSIKEAKEWIHDLEKN